MTTSPDKERAYALNQRHLGAAKVSLFRAIGIDLVIGRREGYRIWDVDGKELLDLHLNGGTYNLGHGHPEVVAALRDALDEGLDIGNHHFASVARGELAEALIASAPDGLARVAFASGGGEAVDIAIKSARRATGRRTIVTLERGYHGHTGLALAAGEPRFSAPFHSEGPADEFVRVPPNDLEAMAAALEAHAVAAVMLEPIPATAGFVVPPEGYLAGVRALCDRHGALFVADEVQTGLGRTGTLWAVDGYGIRPDILVTAKGLGGGVYPIAATLMSERAGQWLTQDSHGHVSTFGGAELGCRVALKVLEVTTRASTVENVARVARRLEEGLADIAARRPFLAEVRQRGLVIGLRFAKDDAGVHVMRKLFDAGVWAIAAGFDYGAIQVKPGLLWDEPTTERALATLDAVIGEVAGVVG